MTDSPDDNDASPPLLWPGIDSFVPLPRMDGRQAIGRALRRDRVAYAPLEIDTNELEARVIASGITEFQRRDLMNAIEAHTPAIVGVDRAVPGADRTVVVRRAEEIADDISRRAMRELTFAERYSAGPETIRQMRDRQGRPVAEVHRAFNSVTQAATASRVSVEDLARLMDQAIQGEPRTRRDGTPVHTGQTVTGRTSSRTPNIAETPPEHANSRCVVEVTESTIPPAPDGFVHTGRMTVTSPPPRDVRTDPLVVRGAALRVSETIWIHPEDLDRAKVEGTITLDFYKMTNREKASAALPRIVPERVNYSHVYTVEVDRTVRSLHRSLYDACVYCLAELGAPDGCTIDNWVLEADVANGMWQRLATTAVSSIVGQYKPKAGDELQSIVDPVLAYNPDLSERVVEAPGDLLRDRVYKALIETRILIAHRALSAVQRNTGMTPRATLTVSIPAWLEPLGLLSDMPPGLVVRYRGAHRDVAAVEVVVDSNPGTYASVDAAGRTGRVGNVKVTHDPLPNRHARVRVRGGL